MPLRVVRYRTKICQQGDEVFPGEGFRGSRRGNGLAWPASDDQAHSFPELPKELPAPVCGRELSVINSQDDHTVVPHYPQQLLHDTTPLRRWQVFEDADARHYGKPAIPER